MDFEAAEQLFLIIFGFLVLILFFTLICRTRCSLSKHKKPVVFMHHEPRYVENTGQEEIVYRNGVAYYHYEEYVDEVEPTHHYVRVSNHRDFERGLSQERISDREMDYRLPMTDSEMEDSPRRHWGRQQRLFAKRAQHAQRISETRL
uniref:Uncharacterized protein n=1 Tax=Ceratitis capitata TaxID=7213 RepID=W8CEC8_CERCA